MYKFFILLLLLSLKICSANNSFSANNYSAFAQFNTDNNYVGTIQISVSNDSDVYITTLQSLVTSEQSPDEAIEIYVDSSLTQPLKDNPIFLTPAGFLHNIVLYIKYINTQNQPHKVGLFNYNTQIQLNDGQTNTAAYLNIQSNILGTCNFEQSVYNAQHASSSNSEIKRSIPISYLCSPGLTPTLRTSQQEYTSQNNITMSIFSDNNYINNIFNNPIPLSATGNLETVNLFIEYFESGNPIVNSIGFYNFSSDLIINY